MSDLPKHLSVSQVSTLVRCGEQYRLQRVWRVPELPGWARIGGSAVHEWTEAWDWSQYGQAEPLSFAYYLDKIASEESEKSGIPISEFKASGRASKAYPNKEDRKWWLDNGPSMCQRWVNWRRTAPWDLWLDEDGRPGIEVEFKVTLGKVDVVGFIDRVMVDHATGTVIVIDIKSGREVPGDFQLGTYRVAMLEKFGVSPKFGGYWYARTGASGSLYPLNEWSLERATWQYEVADSRRKRGDYLPNVSDQCSWCGVRDYCIYYGGQYAGEIRPMWVPVEEWESEEAA